MAGDSPELTADDQADIAEAIRERAAIQEFSGELSRREAERQARAAMRVYRFRLSDDPKKWLTMIAPGSDLADATHTLQLQFGAQRVLEVRPQPIPPSTIKL